MDKIIYNINNNNYIKYINKKNIKKKFINNNNIIHLSVLYNNFNLLKDIKRIYGIKSFYLKNKFGENILHLAGKIKLYNIIDYILNLDVKILEKQDNFGNIFLHYLMDEPKKILEILSKYDKKIKKNKIDLNKISVNNNSFLINFIINSNKKDDNYYKLIKKLLTYNISINNNNLSSLNLSIKLKKYYITDLLLKLKDIDVNIIDNNNVTPIFYCVQNNNLELLKKLIKLGANINYFDNFNNIQFINYVIKIKKLDILKFLLTKNIDCNIIDNNLNLSIYYIILNKYNFDIVYEFIKRTKNLNYQNINRETPLFLLIKNYDWKKFTNILQEKELDIFIKNKKNENLLDFIKDKDKFYKLVVKSYLYYIKNNKNTKSEIIKKCMNKKKLDKECISKISELINKNKKSLITSDIEIKFINNELTFYNKLNTSFIHSVLLFIYLLKKYNDFTIPYIKKVHDFTIPYIKKVHDFNIPYIKKVDDFKLIDNKDKYYLKLKMNNWIKISNFIYKFKYMNIFWVDKDLFWINPNFEESLKNVLNKKEYILISLIIITKETNHQNIIIYDKKKNSLERFEPYGYINNQNSIDLDKFIEKYFKKIIRKVNYISPKDYMHKIGFQNISENESIFDNMKIGDPGGFCIVWCMWYFEMKLMNPNIDNVKLIHKSIKTINNLNKSFTEYIRDYGNKLFTEIEKMFIEINLSKKYYYNKAYNEEILNKILNEIIKVEADKILK